MILMKGFLIPDHAVVVILLVVVLVFPEISSLIIAENVSYSSYSSGSNFNVIDSELFQILGSASINGGALQITPDSMNDTFSLNKSGRALLNREFVLWKERMIGSSDRDHDDIILASFNSTFLINIYPALPSKIPAEGLVFLISPSISFPQGSFGGWLGLHFRVLDIDGDSHNNIVSIELDTYKRDSDPGHIPIGGRIIVPVNVTNYTVWVHYNAKIQVLEVFAVGESNPKPITPVLNATINLKNYLRDYCYFGFSGSTGSTTQLIDVLKWDLMVEILPDTLWKRERGNKFSRIWLTIGLVVVLPGLVFLVVSLWFLCYYRHRAKDVEEQNILLLGALKRLPGTPREFNFKDLKKATNNFNEKMKLGQGGFGVVYKGVLVDHENKEVAVKKFSRESIKGIADFLAELTIINRLRHKHLVPLIGWCHKNRMLLLVLASRVALRASQVALRPRICHASRGK